MANTLPYLTSPGTLTKLLAKVKTAATPERFSQEYLNSTLNMKGGTANSLIPFLKKMGFLDSAGTPTARYNEFRNEKKSGSAIAGALRQLHAPLFAKNESVQALPKADLVGLIVEYTGKAATDRVTELTQQTFQLLKKSADFSAPKPEHAGAEAEKPGGAPPPPANERHTKGVGRAIHLGYTINLYLPSTKEVEVFDAIFRSLKQHLMDEQA